MTGHTATTHGLRLVAPPLLLLRLHLVPPAWHRGGGPGPLLAAEEGAAVAEPPAGRAPRTAAGGDGDQARPRQQPGEGAALLEQEGGRPRAPRVAPAAALAALGHQVAQAGHQLLLQAHRLRTALLGRLAAQLRPQALHDEGGQLLAEGHAALEEPQGHQVVRQGHHHLPKPGWVGVGESDGEHPAVLGSHKAGIEWGHPDEAAEEVEHG